MSQIKFRRLSQEQYDNLQVIDNDCLYLITDSTAIYFNGRCIGGGDIITLVSEIASGKQVIAQAINAKVARQVKMRVSMNLRKIQVECKLHQ